MKLIRSRIPVIVATKEGKALNTSHAPPELFPRLLESKLLEEVSEYMTEPRKPDELVDVLEVIYSLAMIHGISPDALNKMRHDKLQERGSFMERIVLHDTKS